MGTDVTAMTVLAGLDDRVAERRAQPPRRRPLRAVSTTFTPPHGLIGIPGAGGEDFRQWSEWIGRRLAESGPAGIEPHLAAFARVALDLGVEPVHAHVVADRDLHDLTRARAFFKVAMALNDDPDPSVA